MKLAALALTVLLAGCVNHEQRLANQRYEIEQERLQREQYRERVMGQCRAYGFKDGSPEYKNCLMQVDMANQQQDAATRRAIIQMYLMQQAQPAPRPVEPAFIPRTTETNCYRDGQNLRCTTR